jgi:hypothetical protein
LDEALAAAVHAADVARRLSDRPAVVLERIARGGGATRWFFLKSNDAVDQLCGRLSPGSVVSFYFDSRIRRGTFDDEVAGEILDLAAEHGDAVVGWLSDDELEIMVDIIAGPNELSEVGPGLAGGQVFYGAFPGRDNDGLGAITVTLPDADGIVREHPH